MIADRVKNMAPVKCMEILRTVLWSRVMILSELDSVDCDECVDADVAGV